MKCYRLIWLNFVRGGFEGATNIHRRGRSPRNIVDEIEIQICRYKIDIFCDISFEVSKSYGQHRMDILPRCNIHGIIRFIVYMKLYL